MSNKLWVFSENNGPHIRKTSKTWSDEEQFATLDEARAHAIQWAQEQIDELRESIKFWQGCIEEDFE